MFTRHGCLALLLAVLNAVVCLGQENPPAKRAPRTAPREVSLDRGAGRDLLTRDSLAERDARATLDARESRDAMRHDGRHGTTEREQRHLYRDGSERTTRGR